MKNKNMKLYGHQRHIEIFKNICLYTRKARNERYAIKIVKEILKAINSLRLFPFMYPKIYIDRKFKRQLRRATVGKYAVIYEVKNNKILILYIFHENQNYSNLLLNQENLN